MLRSNAVGAISRQQQTRRVVQNPLSRRNNNHNNKSAAVVLSTHRLCVTLSLLLTAVLWLVFSSLQGNDVVVKTLEKEVETLEQVGEAALLKAARSKALQHPSLIQPPPPAVLQQHSHAAVSVTTTKGDNNKSPSAKEKSESSSSSSWTTVEALRKAFYERYDTPQQSARDMQQKAVARFGSLEHTAIRLLQAAARPGEKSFHMGFAGYSVTVGRGNHLEESFPYVIRDLLRPLLFSQLDVHLHVRNAAIGGIPSFPYGFCLSHFLGQQTDVVSWDYSMNEQGKTNTAALESYIRQAQRQFHDRRPMMIILDNHEQRCNLLQEYANRGLVHDAVCLHKPEDAVDDANKSLLDKSGTQTADQVLSMPAGFRHWEEFGAPAKCPGRGNWHPRKQEHAWMAWMLTMYFVDAVEMALQMMRNDEPDWKTKYGPSSEMVLAQEREIVKFPPPLSQQIPDNDPDVTDLLFGHQQHDDNNSYVLKEVSCRTNFLPASDHDNVLPQIVVSGLSPAATVDDIIDERSDDAYRQGWVLDVSSLERKTKVKVENCGGLGYVDMKIAIYGIPDSGVLRLWLPVEHTEHTELAHQDHDHNDAEDTDNNDAEHLLARHWFDTLVICEANEKRADEACHLDRDLEYTVGGVTIPSEKVKMLMGAGEYLKRPTCAHVGIPADAKMTSLADLKTTEGHLVDDDVRIRLSSSHRGNPKELGMIVDLQAKPNVSRKDGACCLSHIVWEQH